MSFRLNADMYVVAPKVQLAHYVDLTMPKRDWSRYDPPVNSRKFMATRFRKPIELGAGAPNLFIQRQAG